jgi:hypothetical protein
MKPKSSSKAINALRDEIARLEAERDSISIEIGNFQRALQMLLSAGGEAFAQLIDMAKVFILRSDDEQSYEQIREFIRTKGGVVVKGDLDHRLRQSLSRAVAGGTIVARHRSDTVFYDLSKKERDRLRKLYPER